jgi:hypothetical protein
VGRSKRRCGLCLPSPSRHRVFCTFLPSQLEALNRRYRVRQRPRFPSSLLESAAEERVERLQPPGRLKQLSVSRAPEDPTELEPQERIVSKAQGCSEPLNLDAWDNAVEGIQEKRNLMTARRTFLPGFKARVVLKELTGGKRVAESCRAQQLKP